MLEMRRHGRTILFAIFLLGAFVAPAHAYIDAPPQTLGRTCDWSTHVIQAQIIAIDKTNQIITWRRIKDYKGNWPGPDVFRHNLAGLPEPERSTVFRSAAVGKTTVIFALLSYKWCHTYLDGVWYASYTADWKEWTSNRLPPLMLRTYCGRAKKLEFVVSEILAGKEVVIPCQGDAKDMAAGRIRGMRASLKLLDYNLIRDFAQWGGDDFTPLLGMPGFSAFSNLTSMGRDASGVSIVDFNGDGKPDICLVAANRVALFQNGDDALYQATIPGLSGGARAACWADFDGDGKPDLFLGTPTGPKLYRNLGNGNFQDVSNLIPPSPYWNITAAAWIDYDGDHKPDLLIADGFRGLRLYRNLTGNFDPPLELSMGKWSQCGPFDNTARKGYVAAFPPEQGIDLKGVYPGKNNQQADWREVNFPDGKVNSLKIYGERDHAFMTVYLYRRITANKAIDLPVSLGSCGPLKIWLNGQNVLDNNVERTAAPDQIKTTLNLKAGNNDLLIKVCCADHGKAAYFNAPAPDESTSPAFEDVSDTVGLGALGVGGSSKGDGLLIADVNGDGRPDILYSAGSGILILNTTDGFEEARDSGISYKTGKVVPVFGNPRGAGAPDLFVPQLDGRCRLFKNDGKAHFTDVTASSGDLIKPMGGATCAAWADLKGSGHCDLIVGCLKSPNRLFRNKGDGTFADATEECGFEKRIFNTQAINVVDLRQDGSLDVIFNNEGQESVLLMGDASRAKAMLAAKSFAVAAIGGVEAGPAVASASAFGDLPTSHHTNWTAAAVLFFAGSIGVAMARAKWRKVVRQKSRPSKKMVNAMALELANE